MASEKTRKKKDGEKAFLLHSCGEYLFGCPGSVLVTQGLYAPGMEAGLECFCKRAVWVPSELNLQHLKGRFDFFDVPFPSILNPNMVIGVCGKNPTRSARANGSTFMIVHMTRRRQFVIDAIAIFDHGQFTEFAKPLVSLRSISSDIDDIDDCIAWIRMEANNFSKGKKHVRAGVKRPPPPPEYYHFANYDAFSSEPGRVFSEPSVLSCLKRKHFNGLSSQPMGFDNPGMRSIGTSALHDSHANYHGVLSLPVISRPAIPPNIGMLPPRQFLITGLRSNIICSSCSYSSPLEGESFGSSRIESPESSGVSSSSMDGVCGYDPRPPTSPSDSLRLMQPVDEVSSTFLP